MNEDKAIAFGQGRRWGELRTHDETTARERRIDKLESMLPSNATGWHQHEYRGHFVLTRKIHFGEGHEWTVQGRFKDPPGGWGRDILSALTQGKLAVNELLGVAHE